MKKDAGVAALLNAIFPGFGWLYCERIFMGIISLLISGVLFFVFNDVYLSFTHYHRDAKIFVGLLCTCYWLFSVIYIFYNVKGFSLFRFLDTAIDEYDSQRIKRINYNIPVDIVCDKCGKTFTAISSDAVECPHCGCINNPFYLKMEKLK